MMRLICLILSCFILTTGNAALSSTDKKLTDIDTFFRHLDLNKLVGTDKVLNLAAQMSDPSASTTRLNELNEFLAIAAVPPDYNATITRFDQEEKIIRRIDYQLPWIGVDQFSPDELPALSLRDGMQLVQACMVSKGEPLLEQVSRVVVYKTLNKSEMIYDYVFKDPYLSEDFCQEMLYSPATGDCQKGREVFCHYVPPEPIK